MIKQKPTIALFGGSFDPPHTAHQAIIEKVSRMSDIDKLIVMPTFLNPFKHSSWATASKRLQWCKTVFTYDKVFVSDFEISQNRPVYTSETISYLKKEYFVKYIVIGSDNLYSLHMWKDFEEINSKITWLIFTRQGFPIASEHLKEYKLLELDISISSTDIRSGDKLKQIDKRIRKDVKNIITKGNKMTIKERVDAIVNILDNKKAEEIEVFDLSGTDYIAKEVIIANSFGGKHTMALYDHLKKELKPQGEDFLAVDESNDWVVADMGDIIVHIMTPAYREHYSIEKFLSTLEPSSTEK